LETVVIFFKKIIYIKLISSIITLVFLSVLKINFIQSFFEKSFKKISSVVYLFNFQFFSPPKLKEKLSNE